MRLFLIYIFLVCFSMASAQQANPILLKSKALASQNKYEEAIQTLISEKTPNIEILKLNGSCFYQMGNYKAALNYYTKADSISANSSSLEIAKCYAIAGNSEKACDWLKKHLTGKNKHSEYEIVTDKAFKPILQSKEWNEIWHNEWYSPSETELFAVKALIKRGNVKLAYEQLSKNKDIIYPKSEVYYAEACLFKNMNQLDAALTSINMAIERNNRNESYFIKKSEILSEKKNYSESVTSISNAIEVNPNEPGYYLLRSETALLAGNYTLSQKDLSFYGNLFPESPETLHQLAKLASAKGNYLDALDYYTKLINTDKQNPQYYSERGETAFNAGRYQMADEDLAMALDSYPNLETANLLKGKIKLYFNDIPSARYYLETAAKNGNSEAKKILLESCK